MIYVGQWLTILRLKADECHGNNPDEPAALREIINTMEPLKNPMTALDLYQLDQCYTENQRWDITLTSHEQETDQLMALLDDVLEQYNYQNMRQRAIDYHQRLSRLKMWFSRLRSDLLCESSNCIPGNEKAGCLRCGKARFSRYMDISLQFTGLSDEFDRTKAGCYQFLSVMVQLNLL